MVLGYTVCVRSPPPAAGLAQPLGLQVRRQQGRMIWCVGMSATPVYDKAIRQDNRYP